jgi:hypothetical protein
MIGGATWGSGETSNRTSVELKLIETGGAGTSGDDY